MRLHKSTLSDISGIGVDIVSIDRIQDFLKRNRSQIRSKIFSSTENKQVIRMNAKKVAESFAAKEAFFKATPENWFGPDSFPQMHLNRITPLKFKISWKDKNRSRNYKGIGVFSYENKHVIAKVVT